MKQNNKATALAVHAAFGLLAAVPAGLACSVSVPQYPFSSVFDGTDVWIVTSGAPTGSGSLVAIDPTTCEIVQTITSPTPAFLGMGIALAFDGTNLWTTGGDWSVIDGDAVYSVLEINPATGQVTPVTASDTDGGLVGGNVIAYVPATKTIWVVGGQYLSVLTLNGTVVVSQIIIGPTGVLSLMAHGNDVYASDGADNVYVIDATTYATVSAIEVPQNGYEARSPLQSGMVWSGGRVWISGNGIISEIVPGGYTSYPVSAPQCGYSQLATDNAGYLYLACAGYEVPTYSVLRFDESTHVVTTTIAVPEDPVALVWSAKNKLWVVSQAASAVTSINIR